MNFQAPYDPLYIQKKVDREKIAQYWMDIWYESNGFEIINRVGNKERDLVLKKNNRICKVEEKFRDIDYGDLLIEVVQDLVNNKPGWFYTETPDILNYVILDNKKEPKTAYWIFFSRLKNWIYKYLSEKKTVKTIISPLGYGLTLNIAISWSVIPENIYSKFEITNTEIIF